MRAFGWLAAAIAREAARPPYASIASVPPWWRWTVVMGYAVCGRMMAAIISERDGIVRDSLLRGVSWS